MRYKVDIALVREGKLNLQGWAFGKDPETAVQYTVTDGTGKQLDDVSVGTVRRDAVVEAFFSEYIRKYGEIRRELGYNIEVPFSHGDVRILQITVDGKTKKIRFDEKTLEAFNSHAHRKREKLLALLNWETVEVSWECLRENGFGVLWKKGWNKIRGIQEDYDYNEWYKQMAPTAETLESQRNRQFSKNISFSIVIPVYKTPEKFLRRMLESIREQTYPLFQVCIADATPYESIHWTRDDGKLPKDILEEYRKRDERFQYVILNENYGISENTNAAIRMATGDYVVLADHDDELTPDALYAMAEILEKRPEIRVLYSDEDKVDFEDAYYFEPHFKPDYDPDLLRSVNYICHLFAVERKLLDSISSLDEKGDRVYERAEYDGAQDYDLILRACEAAEAENKVDAEDLLLKEARYTCRTIYHIPRVLYHWRYHQMSTAANPETKMYAFEAGARAIRAHLERMKYPVKSVETGITYGFYHVKYDNQEPRISVIIPNKDHTEDLDKAIRSLAGGSYKNLEFIIVENNSTDDKTFVYYDKIQKDKTLPPVRVVRWEREFNYSAINNFGVQFAEGDYYLFLNNDIELIAEDSLHEMVGFVQREDVGICGARLLYPDEVIQHAGVIIGFGGIAGAAFVGIHDKELTYMHRAKCIQDLSAVTAACLLTRRDVFEAVGGFAEELAVAFNDVDYCLKVRRLNKKVVYNPYALFYHYESKSRGLEDTPEKVARFNGEIVTFAKRWPEILKAGDPYYHPALTFRKSNFVLKDLTRETVGKPFHMDILAGIVDQD